MKPEAKRPESLTVNEIAKELSVGLSTVRIWVNSGKLLHYRLPGSKKQPIIRIRREAYEQFLKDCEKGS